MSINICWNIYTRFTYVLCGSISIRKLLKKASSNDKENVSGKNTIFQKTFKLLVLVIAAFILPTQKLKRGFNFFGTSA